MKVEKREKCAFGPARRTRQFHDYRLPLAVFAAALICSVVPW